MDTNFYYFADGVLENKRTNPRGVDNIWRGEGFLRIYECRPDELQKCIDAASLLMGFYTLEVYDISKRYLHEIVACKPYKKFDRRALDTSLIKDSVYGRLLLWDVIEWDYLTLVRKIIYEVVEEDELF